MADILSLDATAQIMALQAKRISAVELLELSGALIIIDLGRTRLNCLVVGHVKVRHNPDMGFRDGLYRPLW